MLRSGRKRCTPKRGTPKLAIYHLAVKSVSRTTGRSAPAAAAYRAGERIENTRDGLVHDYRARGGVEDTLIVAPAGAEWALDRSALWNAAEVAEKRKDAKVAREYELALPAELTKGQRLELVREFAEAVCQRYGVAVDAALHGPHDYGDDRNHHAHVLTTTRAVTAKGLGAKTRQLDVSTTASIEVEAIRALWESQANAALEAAGVAARIDARSLAAQGIERMPTMHLGATAAALEREAVPTRRGDHNRAVANDNDAQKRLSAEIVDLRAERDRRAVPEAGVAASTAPARGIEGDRRRDGARVSERAATAAPGHVLMDAAYALASSAQDREAIAVMNALTRLFRRLGPIAAQVPQKVAAPPPTASEIVRRWEAERQYQLGRVEAKVARVDRYGRALLDKHQSRRKEHRQQEPGRLAAMVPGRRAAWERMRDAIEQRIDRIAAQLTRIAMFDRRYGNADWASADAGAGERLAHRKAAAILPELATAYQAARVEVIEQRFAEAAVEKARVAQLRDQGRGRGR